MFKSEPIYRRIWIDKVVSQLEPVYLDLISRFNRLLKQRSHFWRSESFLNNHSADIVESFDIQMSIISTRIFRRRRRALLKIQPYVEYWHNHLSKSKEQIDINYLSGIQNICPEEEEEEVIEEVTEEIEFEEELDEIKEDASLIEKSLGMLAVTDNNEDPLTPLDKNLQVLKNFKTIILF